MHMKPGAIFDMDGLLLDTERVYQESWIAVTEEFGQPQNPAFPPAVSGTSGRIMREIIHSYYPEVNEDDFVAACVARVERVIDGQGAQEKLGAGELLAYLHGRGVKIAVASSSPLARIRKNLESAGLARYFHVMVSGQEVERGKPEPDVFLLAAQRLGVAPEECYVFEDSLNGVRAGMAAGCRTVMVPDLVRPPEDLEVFRVCESLLEARDLIEKGEL